MTAPDGAAPDGAAPDPVAPLLARLALGAAQVDPSRVPTGYPSLDQAGLGVCGPLRCRRLRPLRGGAGPLSRGAQYTSPPAGRIFPGRSHPRLRGWHGRA